MVHSNRRVYKFQTIRHICISTSSTTTIGPMNKNFDATQILFMDVDVYASVVETANSLQVHIKESYVSFALHLSGVSRCIPRENACCNVLVVVCRKARISFVNAVLRNIDREVDLDWRLHR